MLLRAVVLALALLFLAALRLWVRKQSLVAAASAGSRASPRCLIMATKCGLFHPF